MKRFSCGDVVPGCSETFVGSTDDEILREVAAHAAEIHGMTTVPDEVVEQVRQRILTSA